MELTLASASAKDTAGFSPRSWDSSSSSSPSSVQHQTSWVHLCNFDLLLLFLTCVSAKRHLALKSRLFWALLTLSLANPKPPDDSGANQPSAIISSSGCDFLHRFTSGGKLSCQQQFWLEYSLWLWRTGTWCLVLSSGSHVFPPNIMLTPPFSCSAAL